MLIPMQISVRRSSNPRYYRNVSQVTNYDQAMMSVFPFFVMTDAISIGFLTKLLSNGFSENGYGPFWPSFASMNAGDGLNKVLWLSQAGVDCLQKTAGKGYLIQLEEKEGVNG